ncbi:MAG: hypothetical protein BGO09_03880 [Bacteroidetes bacterium 47-18]|nr:MAG: hypothetical protein BGO09_03880 [Bacteroidetes bacterium 47-18]
MTIKTLIIDDEPLACMLLQDMLSAHPEIEIIGQCHDGFEGLKQIQALKPDLIFVDIQMPKITGVEMIELVDEKPLIVFSTAYDQYAVKAFEMNAVDYLLKPYDNNRIASAVTKIKEKYRLSSRNNDIQISTPESSQRIVIKENGLIKIIPTDQVMYLEAAGDYVKIYTAEKFYVKHGRMSHFEEILSKIPFIRIHRSYLMNFNYLNAIEPYQSTSLAILKNGTKLPVSKSGYELLKHNIS